MSALETVECMSPVTVTTKAHMRHLCPYRNEVDEGLITISWEVAGRTIELHSLHEYLRGFKDSVMSHEELTDRVRHDLECETGIDWMTVKGMQESIPPAYSHYIGRQLMAHIEQEAVA